MIYKYLNIIFFLLLPATSLWAQSTHGDCEPASANNFLDINNVRAAVFNSGSLFRGDDYRSVYTIPRIDSDRKDAIYSTDIWIAGLVEGELRMAVADGFGAEFWSGPLQENGMAPNDCSMYDRVYKVSLSDIENYDSGEIDLNPDLIEWPYELGAPVIDGDGITGNYDLEAGDRPEILGHQNIWWVMNDRGNEHRNTLSAPLGIEVRATAFALQYPGHLNNTSFYQYEIKNRSDNTIKEAYFAIRADPDLGNWNDDYVGSDSLLGLSYAWNGKDIDSGLGGYGDRPPAVGFDFVDAPLAEADGLDNDYDGEIDEPNEKLQLHSFLYYNGDATTHGVPVSIWDKYRYMRGLWRDGQPMTYGGPGRGFSETPTRFMFPGDAPAFWSEENTDGQGIRNAPADRRFISSVGPFDIQPGETKTITLAIVWAQGEDRFDSVRLLKDASRYVQAGYNAGVHKNNEYLAMPDVDLPMFLKVGAPFPNPSSGEINLYYELNTSAELEVSLFDVQGREVRKMISQVREAGEYRVKVDVGDLTSSIYFLRYSISGASKYFPISIIGQE